MKETMSANRRFGSMPAVAVCAYVAALLAPALAHAQVFTLSKEQLIDYTAQNPFERFPDGRPKIPDTHAGEGARADVSRGRVWAVLPGKKFSLISMPTASRFCIPGKNDGWPRLHGSVHAAPPGRGIGWSRRKRKRPACRRLKNQTALDMLQPGDVLVVDLFGKKVNGTIVGDNLFYYTMQGRRTPEA